MGEVASPKSLDGGEKINSILNFCDSAEGIYDAFINPKYKVMSNIIGCPNKTMLQVGTEWVCKTQNTNSCEVSTGSIIKNIYGRLFRYIVDMCNNTLIVSHYLNLSLYFFLKLVEYFPSFYLVVVVVRTQP